MQLDELTNTVIYHSLHPPSVIKATSLPSPAPITIQVTAPASQQYPGQHPQQQQQPQSQTASHQYAIQLQPGAGTDANPSREVHVPSASTCARCNSTGVDTQLRPCGHMFHSECITPWLTERHPSCPLCKYDVNPASEDDDSQFPRLWALTEAISRIIPLVFQAVQ